MATQPRRRQSTASLESHESLIAALEAIVGREHVLDDAESRERYSFDAAQPQRLHGREALAEARVDAVVRPANTAEVSRVVRFAHDAGVPVVPYGGGTGVMGAIIPVRSGVALDLGRMNRILEVGRQDRLARVQPAVFLASLDAEAQRHGLILGHDPWSVPIATVGGAISTDSVGYRASKYGSMGQQVRALEVVLGDGTIVRTRPLARQSSGPMLSGLFVGAEGAMGVVTEATVQLYTEPEARQFATVGFESFEVGFPVVVKLFDLGLAPALVDLTEEEPQEGSRGFRCLLYLGFEGYREEVEAQHNRALAEAMAAGGRDIGSGPTEQYWAARHAVAERWKERTKPLLPTERWRERRWRSADYLHVSLPVSRVLDYKRTAERIAAESELVIREAAIWTSPQLFSIFIVDPAGADDGGSPKIGRAVEQLVEEVLRLDGGIEYCHGIGMKLEPWATREWGDALALARLMKRAVDPRGVLNPGKLGL